MNIFRQISCNINSDILRLVCLDAVGRVGGLMCDDKRKVNFLEQLSLLCPQAGDLLGEWGEGKRGEEEGEGEKMKTKVSAYLVFIG